MDFNAPGIVGLIGPPGAGKTTWLKDNLPDAQRVSLEAIRMDPKANRDAIIQASFGEVIHALRAGKLVAYDATLIQPQMRAGLIQIARDEGVRAHAVIFNTPLEDCLRAQDARTHPVPADRVEELWNEAQAAFRAVPGEGWTSVDEVKRQPIKEATMGRTMNDAATERRDIISMGDRVLADSLVDGVQEYGRFDQTTVQYDPQAGKCGGCIFYRGEAYDGPEACVLVAADVNAQGGCRIGIQGELPGALEDEDPGMPSESGEMEDETSLTDALEDIDEALGLGESDEDDEEDQDDEIADAPSANSGVSVVVNIDLDSDVGQNHNASDGSAAVAEGDIDMVDADTSIPWRSHEIHTARHATAIWRASGRSSQYRNLQGYTAVFNTPSVDLGGFREILAPGCFTRALEDPNLDCALLWNHDPDTIMASTRNGSLELKQDQRGLKIWARVNMNDFDVQRALGKVTEGLTDQMSFAFSIADEGDEWSVREGMPFRTVRDIAGVFDASIVSNAAYPNGPKVEVLERAIRAGRVPGMERAITVAQADPAGIASSLNPEGEALQRLKLKARSRLAIVKLNLSR
jgi:HK97 family phage prohead protease